MQQIITPKLFDTDNIQPILADTFQEESTRTVAFVPGFMPEDQLPEARDVILSHQVRHQVAIPPNYDYIPLSQHVSPEEPAKVFPFELDPFQKVAIQCIERSESILVSAHTSAGKTAVAEYAIAQALKKGERVIYTSPIKALSNQKYRELESFFGDVGLITGDVSIKPDASCLVMTTEILLTMLYRGNEMMHEVSWVIFDEIHYMKDQVRGVVWEETIILLSNKIHFVFLSATIPNAMEFAEWICKIHAQPCHVVYTDFRPTPLQHYIFPCGGDGILMIADEEGNFQEENFRKATGMLDVDANVEYFDYKGKKTIIPSGKEKSDIYKIVSMVMEKVYDPVIIFTFGRRECENLAMQVNHLDLTGDEEKDLIQQVFDNALSMLPDDDQDLSQIGNMLPFLRRGIAIHHSGLLPFLKEVVELLFQEGLIKILFATETFSMGLNMPARTVVFSDIKKFDGQCLTSGEYIQMSGRAGRRGLDSRGIVIIMAKEKLEPSIVKGMVMGRPDNLYSAFHLKYSMILNMTRVEGISPDYILQRSFYQFQNTAGLPKLETELSKLEKEYKDFDVPEEDAIKEYFNIRSLLDSYIHDIRNIVNHPLNILKFMRPGRLVWVKHANMEFGWGMVVAWGKKKQDPSFEAKNTLNPTENNSELNQPAAENPGENSEEIIEENLEKLEFSLPPDHYFVDVLLNCDPESVVAKSADGKLIGVKPYKGDGLGEMMIVPVELSTLHYISQIRVFSPKNLSHRDYRDAVYDSIIDIQERFPEGIPLLDPIEHMGIDDESFQKLIRVLESRLVTSQLHNTERLPKLYELYCKKNDLKHKLKLLKKTINISRSILQLDDLRCRKRVLRRLGYLTGDDVVTIKGRVACEINAGDELVLTEMLLNGVFNDLSSEMTAALLSCFVLEQPGEKKTGLVKEEFYTIYRRLQETARNIAAVTVECNIALDEDQYLCTFPPNMMEVVYNWCQGKPFSQIMKMTDSVFEGEIVRMFRYLDEMLKGMIAASKIIGNNELVEKFNEAIGKSRQNTSLFNYSYDVVMTSLEGFMNWILNPYFLDNSGASRDHRYQPTLWNFLYSYNLFLALFTNVVINRIYAIVTIHNPRPLPFKARLLVRIPSIYYLTKALMVLTARLAIEIPSLQSFLFQSILDLANDYNNQQALWLTFKSFSGVYVLKAFHCCLENRVLPGREQSTTLYEYSLLFHFCDISSGKSNADLLLIAFFENLDVLLLETLYLHPSGLQYRLITTSIVGISGLVHYIYAMCYRSDTYPIFQSFVRFPELALFVLIFICFSIHIIAYILTGGNIRRRFFLDLSSLPSLSGDYTLEIYRIGTIIIETQHIQGFRNELPPIYLPSSTYLERSRRNSRRQASIEQSNTIRPRPGFDNLQNNNTSGSTDLHIQPFATWTRFFMKVIQLFYVTTLRIGAWIKPSFSSDRNDLREHYSSTSTSITRYALAHFSCPNVLTRRKCQENSNNNSLSAQSSHMNELSAISALMNERRKPNKIFNLRSSDSHCVVCLIEPRLCVLKPCGCLAICELVSVVLEKRKNPIPWSPL
nr:7099_t:CDS:10 [Entrophospora candida]